MRSDRLVGARVVVEEALDFSLDALVIVLRLKARSLDQLPLNSTASKVRLAERGRAIGAPARTGDPSADTPYGENVTVMVLGSVSKAHFWM